MNVFYTKNLADSSIRLHRRHQRHTVRVLRFETFLPDGFHTIAEIIENATTLNATTGGEETTDDTGNMSSDIELLRILYSYTFYTKAETANARKNYRLPIGQTLLKNVLQFGDNSYDIAIFKTAVSTGFCCDFIERHFALTYSLCKILSVSATTLNIISYKFYMY